MSKSKAKSLSELIAGEGSELSRLASAARLRTDLSEHLRSRLEPALAAGFMHCNMRDDGTLVVYASSPEWATRLRFETQELLGLCREFGSPASSVKVRVTGQQ